MNSGYCFIISHYHISCHLHFKKRLSWLWSYGSWIYNYLYNQCLSSLKLWFRIPLMARCTWYNNMWSSLSVTCDRSVVFSGLRSWYCNVKQWNKHVLSHLANYWFFIHMEISVFQSYVITPIWHKVANFDIPVYIYITVACMSLLLWLHVS